MTYIHHQSVIKHIFSALKRLSVLHLFIPLLQTLATTDLFTVSRLCFPFQNVIGLESNCLQSFQIGFFHVSYMSFHVLIAHFFLKLNNIPLSGYHRQLTNSPTKGHLCCFQVVIIINKADKNFYLQQTIFLKIKVYSFSSLIIPNMKQVHG